MQKNFLNAYIADEILLVSSLYVEQDKKLYILLTQHRTFTTLLETALLEFS